MSTTETFNIVGDMADKIKNNVKEHVQQFSWKLTFPKDVVVDAIPAEDIVILNKQIKRLRSEFVIYPKENAILISPQVPYKPDQEYYFWAKYKKKEICVAFMLTEGNELKTFDQKTSLEKLNATIKRVNNQKALQESVKVNKKAESSLKENADEVVE